MYASETSATNTPAVPEFGTLNNESNEKLGGRVGSTFFKGV